VAVIINAVQGAAIGFWAANAVLVTLAADGLQQGIASTLTGDHYVNPPPTDTGWEVLADGRVLGIPITVYIFVGLGIAMWLFLRTSVFGMQMYMMGNNRLAAKAAGLRVTALTIGTFALAGLAAGVAGILLAAGNRSASLALIGNNTLYAITAVLVGGNAVGGGRGSVLRTMFGAIGVAAIANLAVLRGYGNGGQIAVQGALIFVVVVFLHVTRSAEAKAG